MVEHTCDRERNEIFKIVSSINETKPQSTMKISSHVKVEVNEVSQMSSTGVVNPTFTDDTDQMVTYL